MTCSIWENGFKASPGFWGGHVRWILISLWSRSGFPRVRSEFLLFSLSLWDQWKISPTVQTGFLSLSLLTFTHYVCTDASRFAALQLGAGLISEIWIDFDFTRSPVEVLKPISRADRAPAQPASCFPRQLSEVTRSGCVHTVELIRARDQKEFKYGLSSRLFTLLLFVFKVMAERGARLLLSLFCLTITVSHAEKGKIEL